MIKSSFVKIKWMHKNVALKQACALKQVYVLASFRAHAWFTAHSSAF
jgi:hypothetical protein